VDLEGPTMARYLGKVPWQGGTWPFDLAFITEIQNQPGNSNLRTVIRSERITVRIHDELQSAVICELQSAFRGAARRSAWPGTESPAVPVWDLLGPPALPSATPTVSAVETCPRRNCGGVRVARASLAPTARLVRLLRSAASGPVQPPRWCHCKLSGNWPWDFNAEVGPRQT